MLSNSRLGLALIGLCAVSGAQNVNQHKLIVREEASLGGYLELETLHVMESAVLWIDGDLTIVAEEITVDGAIAARSERSQSVTLISSNPIYIDGMVSAGSGEGYLGMAPERTLGIRGGNGGDAVIIAPRVFLGPEGQVYSGKGGHGGAGSHGGDGGDIAILGNLLFGGTNVSASIVPGVGGRGGDGHWPLGDGGDGGNIGSVIVGKVVTLPVQTLDLSASCSDGVRGNDGAGANGQPGSDGGHGALGNFFNPNGGNGGDGGPGENAFAGDATDGTSGSSCCAPPSAGGNGGDGGDGGTADGGIGGIGGNGGTALADAGTGMFIGRGGDGGKGGKGGDAHGGDAGKGGFGGDGCPAGAKGVKGAPGGARAGPGGLGGAGGAGSPAGNAGSQGVAGTATPGTPMEDGQAGTPCCDE